MLFGCVIYERLSACVCRPRLVARLPLRPLGPRAEGPPRTDLCYRAATTGPTSCRGPCRDTCRLQVMHAYIHTRTYTIHTYTYAHTRIHTYTYAHTHCAVPTYTYIHTHTYTLYRHQVIHTYIHTCTYTPC